MNNKKSEIKNMQYVIHYKMYYILHIKQMKMKSDKMYYKMYYNYEKYQSEIGVV